MTDQIQKYYFRKKTDLQIEVVSLDILISANKDHVITPHRTNFYHVFIFDDCQPTHLVDFEPIRISPYSLLFIDKDRVHQFDRLLDYEGYVVIFTGDFFCTSDSDVKFLRSSVLFNDLVDKPSFKPDTVTYRKLTRICDDIKEELSLPADDSKHIVVKNLLHNFLLLAAREKRKQGFTELKKGADLDYTMLFSDLLEANFINLKSVKDYTNILCLSEKRLRQATVKVLGKPPKEIINDRVLLEAKRLLVHTHSSIKEIGQELGFEDPAYFIRYFKNNTKATPVEFRETYLKK